MLGELVGIGQVIQDEVIAQTGLKTTSVRPSET
jgi:hypothetical protein